MKSLEEANMYLAEDRILCLEIFSRIGKRYSLAYVPDAYSMVDPVTSLTRFLGQRRRWINGSWFALQYVLKSNDQAKQSDHKKHYWDLILFQFSMQWARLGRFLTYFAIALYFAVLYILLGQFLGNSNLSNKQIFLF
jgi:chitin synthase